MPASRVARTSLRLSIVSLALLPLSAFGTRFGMLPFQVGLLLFVASVLAGFAAISISALFTRRQKNDESRKMLSNAALLSLPALTFFAFTMVRGGNAPMIHEVSTDRLNPPQYVKAVDERGPEANPLDYSTEVAQVQAQAYPELTPLKTDLTPSEAFQRALAVSQELGWNVYYEDDAKGQIEAVATSRWFGFKDDIAIRIQPEGAGSIIDLRSASRFGKGDLGANAAHINKFLAHFRISA